MDDYELCVVCGTRTGKAGRDEDSLYLGCVGPLCDDCYDEATAERNELQARVAELEAVARVLAEQAVAHEWGQLCDGRSSQVQMLFEDTEGAIRWAQERVAAANLSSPASRQFQRKAAEDVKENNKRFDAMSEPLDVEQQHTVIGDEPKENGDREGNYQYAEERAHWEKVDELLGIEPEQEQPKEDGDE